MDIQRRTKVIEFPPSTEAKKVLIVEDEYSFRELWTSLLEEDGYAVVTAADGASAIAAAKQHAPDLILLDVLLPDTTGFEVARALKGSPVTEASPIIMVTALNDRESKLFGLEAGAEDFIIKPFDRVELSMRIRNLLRLKEHSDILGRFSQILVEKIDERTKDLRDSHREALYILTRAMEYRDEDAGNHVQRMSHYCMELAARLGLGRDFQDTIFHAAPLHDVGKIGIPDSILIKRGPLDDGELEIMRTHCGLGAQILGQATSPYMKMGAEIALHHHEHWDGTGYPDGLRGEAIPLSARIVRIADVYDTLRSRRPYKTAMPHQSAVEAISQGDRRTRPEHFDPSVIEAFLGCESQLAQIYTDLS